MKTKISAVLIIIVLLGVTSSATSANAQQVITPQGLIPQNQPVQQSQQEFNQPIPLQDATITTTPQDSTYNNYQPAVVDLNNPNTNPSLITNHNVLALENTQAEQVQQQPIPITCASGVFVYQQNTLTGQVVPICVTSDMLANQLFNIDLNVKSSNNNNDDDDDDDDNDKKKHHYYKYVNWNPRYDPIYKGANDPRNDPKYDSIDWQDDDPDKNLSVKAMDEILEDQQEEKENNGSDETTGQSNNDNDSGDSDGGSSDSESSDSDSGSSDDDSGDSNDSGSSDSGNSGSDGGDSGGSDGGSSDGGSSDSGGSGGDDSNN